MPYHHGDLRNAILRAAADAIEREGPGGLSLRALARAVGVSHTAPRHHLGDKRGVLTALASQGYRSLTEDITAANETGLLEAGVAYVRFADQHPGHFAVMFRPDLVDQTDAELGHAISSLEAALRSGVRAPAGARGPSKGEGDVSGASLARAAWSIAHGFATLARNGNFPQASGENLTDLARDTLRHLAVR